MLTMDIGVGLIFSSLFGFSFYVCFSCLLTVFGSSQVQSIQTVATS